MTRPHFFPAIAFLLSCPPSFAGTYGPQDFNSLAVGATNAGDGTVMTGSTPSGTDPNVVSIQNRPGSTTDRALRLTYLNGLSILRGNFQIPVLDPGAVIRPSIGLLADA